MKGLSEYQTISNQSSVVDADNHQLITLLYDKVIESISVAKVHIEHKRYDAKSNAINKAIEVIGGLREFLDFEKGGEIALRLEQLYEWSERTLFAATKDNDIEMLNSVDLVIREIREGWQGIRSASSKSTPKSEQQSTPAQ